MRGLLAHLRLELALLFRNGESLLLTLGIPVLLLVFFSNVDVLPIDGEPIQFLAPGVLALAVLSTALVQTAIGTGFEREYGVLKRLGATPLGRPRLLAAKTLAILVVELVQGAVLWGVALACGWDPSVSAGRLAGAVVLGTVGCAALGLCLAGTPPGPRHAGRRQRPLPRAAPALRHGHPPRRAPRRRRAPWPVRSPAAPSPRPSAAASPPASTSPAERGWCWPRGPSPPPSPPPASSAGRERASKNP